MDRETSLNVRSQQPEQAMTDRPHVSRWLAAILFPLHATIHEMVFQDRSVRRAQYPIVGAVHSHADSSIAMGPIHGLLCRESSLPVLHDEP